VSGKYTENSGYLERRVGGGGTVVTNDPGSLEFMSGGEVDCD